MYINCNILQAYQKLMEECIGKYIHLSTVSDSKLKYKYNRTNTWGTEQRKRIMSLRKSSRKYYYIIGDPSETDMPDRKPIVDQHD